MNNIRDDLPFIKGVISGLYILASLGAAEIARYTAGNDIATGVFFSGAVYTLFQNYRIEHKFKKENIEDARDLKRKADKTKLKGGTFIKAGVIGTLASIGAGSLTHMATHSEMFGRGVTICGILVYGAVLSAAYHQGKIVQKATLARERFLKECRDNRNGQGRN